LGHELESGEGIFMGSILRIALATSLLAGAAIMPGAPAVAGRDENPDGYGLYSPLKGKHKVYRYDPRSYYYRQPGFYPWYTTNYWVPRSHMRYRYRYTYYGPRYRYYPAWGYPLWGYPAPERRCCR
jgi:hypothetical protein